MELTAEQTEESVSATLNSMETNQQEKQLTKHQWESFYLKTKNTQNSALLWLAKFTRDRR